MNNLVFVKLGGSLITDKRRPKTPRLQLIQRLAREVARARSTDPSLTVVLGHGSGSFGHWEANQYGTRSRVATPDEWFGFARVSAAAQQLNRLVVECFIDAGVPVLSLQPSASAQAKDGALLALNTQTLKLALAHHLVPLVFGDVAFDEVRGGTILSTEDIFFHLARQLHPTRILLMGNAPGVLADQGKVIPTITPENYGEVRAHLHGSGYTDVTGGMAEKVERMMELVEAQPDLRVWIMTGRKPGRLRRALLNSETKLGTLICAAGRAAGCNPPSE